MGRFQIVVLMLLFSTIGSSLVHAQIRGPYEYSNEMVFGITKATNSGLIGGFSFKYSHQLKKQNHFHGGMIEIVNIKHPQEVRYWSTAGNTFIWGKQHYLYSLRFSYTRDFVLFKKASQQGVQVNGFIALGPTLGLEAPYYVHVNLGGGRTVREPYDPNKHSFEDIIGTGNLLQGVFDSNIVPGINAKTGLTFEFGSFKSNVLGLEVGFQCDFFTRPIIIMPTTINYSNFPSAYVALIIGSRK